MAFQSLCAGLAAGAVLVWALLHAGWAAGPSLATAALMAVLVVGYAARALRQHPCDLLWDGQVWHADGQPGSLDLMIDLNAWMLLRLRPVTGGRARWLALTAADAGASIQALRTALYARAPTVDAGIETQVRP